MTSKEGKTKIYKELRARGWTLKEIAAQFGISYQAVQSRLKNSHKYKSLNLH